MPESLDSPDAVVAHLEAHPPTTALWVGVWLEGLGLAMLVLLAARIAGRIRAVDPAGGVPSAAVGLAVAAFTVKLAAFAPSSAALRAARCGAGTVPALLDGDGAAYVLRWALDGAVARLPGLGALATRAVPGWLVGLTTAAGVAALVGIAVPATFGARQFVFLVWVLVVSGWLLARGGQSSGVPADGSAVVAARP